MPLMQASWSIHTTPPLSGQENMDMDRQSLQNVAERLQPPTLRFFRFKNPTVTYGRLQKREEVLRYAPAEWEVVQRPTGGGIVFHQSDLCLSLCWPHDMSPLPSRPTDQYRWIHQVIQEAMQIPTQLATCQDCSSPRDAFHSRQCFTQPVAYDLLLNSQKVVGGALCRTRQATLYQGSIQSISSPELIPALQRVFQSRLSH